MTRIERDLMEYCGLTRAEAEQAQDDLWDLAKIAAETGDDGVLIEDLESFGLDERYADDLL